ncbi:phospholipase D-like domain-containing protein, partial [Gammaproteobacteria bacterium]|nr:phospholipase D-like domain-containing protein [Gammaproteobacteria bacterium]
VGWVTYSFAGLLGFSGGAAVIAVALLASGGAILSSKDSEAIIAVGKKLTGFLNEKYPCPTCGHSSWEFSGYRDAEIITGSGHKQELIAAFQNANKDLYIASGFLSSNVVDQRFLTELEKLLEKKTSITLIFSGSASHSDFMKEGYAEGFRSLEALSHQHPNLKLIQKHTHQKGIVVDTQYAIVGSFNFLSNQMVTRQETSSKLYDQRAIENFKRELLRK